MGTDHDLAIIIPGYKSEYLARALHCVAQQTNQQFDLHVFDDASPSDLSGITRDVLRARKHSFHRFESNLGKYSLVRHWERCITLTRAPWIWLFSDDDLMDLECVEGFYRAREAKEGAADVYRFDAWMINEQDTIVGLHSHHPEEESWLEFAFARLSGWRPSFMQQIIFSREAWNTAGGFVDLPLAWCADDAAIVAMSQRRLIRRIDKAKVSWRHSPHNISPDGSFASGKLKLRAVCLYLKWLSGQLQCSNESIFVDDRRAFASAMQKFLRRAVISEGPFAAIAAWNLLISTAKEICQVSPLSIMPDIALGLASRAILGLSALFKSVDRRKMIANLGKE